jgi:hypothetical protein
MLLESQRKNTSANAKTVVSMIHCADGSQTFLNAYDVTRSSETGEKLPELFEIQMKLPKKLIRLVFLLL